MSKFIDRLKQISLPSPKVMGFRQNNETTTRLKIQLVAFVNRSTDTIVNKLSAADAIIINDIKQLPPDILWGFAAEKVSIEEVDKAVEAGSDFVVLPADEEVLSPDKNTGKVLQLDESVSDILLRAVNELPFDAVLVNGDSETGTTITWRKLMQFSRFSGLVSKPVLVFIPPEVSSAELQLIWEMGISGVVISVKTASDVNLLNKVREMINGLQHPSPKKKERLIPFLPQGSTPAAKPEEPDEDDDDDDD